MQKPTQPQEIIDLEDQLIDATVQGSYLTLAEQILSVMDMAELAVKRAEERHPKLFSEGWGRYEPLMDDTDLDRRAFCIEHYNLGDKNIILVNIYIRLITQVRRLAETVFRSVTANTRHEPNDTIQYHLRKRLTPPATPSLAMLDAITPNIFAIFMQATRLIGNIDNRTALLEEATVRKRAKNGGDAAKKGTQELINHFTDVINGLPKSETWDTLKGMTEDKSKVLYEKLAEFHRSNREKEKSISAGLNIGRNSFYNCFRRWADQSTDFEAALKKRVPKYFKRKAKQRTL